MFVDNGWVGVNEIEIRSLKFGLLEESLEIFFESRFRLVFFNTRF